MTFLLGAAVTQLAYSRGGEGQRWRGWILGFSGFVVAALVDSLVTFLIVFASATIAAGLRSLGGKRDSAFALSAAADALLGLAFSARHASGAGWELASPGAWDEAQFLLATASVLKLLAGSLRNAESNSILWWQGAYLGWSANRSAALWLAVATIGFLVWQIYRVFSQKRSGAVLLAASIVLVLSATGSGPSGRWGPLFVLAVGLSAAGFELGNRNFALWGLAVLPFSVLSIASSQLGAELFRVHTAELAVTAGVVVPVIWSGAAGALATSPRKSPFGGGLGAASFLITFLAAGLRAPSLLPWMIYLTLMGVGGWLIIRRVSRAQGFAPSFQVGALVPDETEGGSSPWPGYVGFIFVGAWAILSLRLLLIGVSTGFL